MERNSRLYRKLSSLKKAIFGDRRIPLIEKVKREVVKQKVPENKEKPNKVKNNKIETIECLFSKYCSGCGACANLCPSGAIQLKLNEEGFWQPVVDKQRCIKCGDCKKSCPSINTVYKNVDKPTCYAAYASDEIRKESTSGGIFSVLANYIFDQGGYVCGAVYDEDFTVRHRIISDRKDLGLLQKSKYVQSNPGSVYKEIKALLEKGKYVLFCGCGCQVAGLKAVLGQESYDKLYTIDLMCHGAPSPKLFQYYLETYRDKDNLDFIGFREKEFFGWSSGGVTTRTKNGQVSRTSRINDPYYRAFQAGVSLREYCEHCAFCKLPRQGDITLADFWGIEQYNKSLTDGRGTSLISVNSEAGNLLLEKIRKNLLLCKKVPLEAIPPGQPFLHPFRGNPDRKRYFELIRSGYSLEKAFDYAVKQKYDVGVYGVWYGSNYGSVATYYALHEVLRSLGLTVLMIDKIRSKEDNERNPYLHSRIFAKKHNYNVSESCTIHGQRSLNNRVDTFILGSDQVFNRFINRYAGYSFYFDFVDKTKKKIAFASSFGHERDFSNDFETLTIKSYLSRFDGIGVRESSGVSICQDKFGVHAVRVLDPVFIADRKIFDALAEEASTYRVYDSNKTLTAYILDPTEEKRKAVLHIAKKLGLRPVLMLDGRSTHIEKDMKIMGMDENVVTVSGVEEWLYYFKSADFVLTDSCHGTSFSILFDKQFIAIANSSRGLTRFESLANLFGLRDHLVYEASEILRNDNLFNPIDYDSVHRILAAEKERSLNWLKTKLFEPKVISSHCAYPVVDQRVLGTEYIGTARKLKDEKLL